MNNNFINQSIQIYLESFTIFCKFVWILGYYTGKLYYSTIKWILQVLYDSQHLMKSRNWNNLQFLLPIAITSYVIVKPLWNFTYNFYVNLPQSPGNTITTSQYELKSVDNSDINSYQAMTVRQLRQLVRTKGIPGLSKANKTKLIATLTAIN